MNENRNIGHLPTSEDERPERREWSPPRLERLELEESAAKLPAPQEAGSTSMPS